MRRAVLVLALAVWAAVACNDVVKPEPGLLVLVVSGTQPDDAALLLRISGPDSLTADVDVAAGYTAHTRAVGGELRVAVFGAVHDGELLKFAVPDVRQAWAYTATLMDVADTTNAVRAAIPGYALIVAR